MGCVRAGRGQAAKVVLSQESRRRAPQRSDVERPTQRPLVRLSKRRRSSLIRSDQISIAARRRAAPRVKPRHHPRDSLHPDVSWQQRIERATQLVSAPPIGRRKTHRLTEGMHPSIGPAGACGNRPAPPPPPPPPPTAGPPPRRPLPIRRASTASNSDCTVRSFGWRCHPAKPPPSYWTTARKGRLVTG